MLTIRPGDILPTARITAADIAPSTAVAYRLSAMPTVCRVGWVVDDVVLVRYEGGRRKSMSVRDFWATHERIEGATTMSDTPRPTDADADPDEIDPVDPEDDDDDDWEDDEDRDDDLDPDLDDDDDDEETDDDA